MQEYEVLKDNRDFVRLYKRGKCILTPSFALYYGKNRSGKLRIGITAGKKLGSAVKRNRAKRVIREAVRKNTGLFPCAADVVIVARFRATYLKSFKIEENLKTALQGVFTEE